MAISANRKAAPKRKAVRRRVAVKITRATTPSTPPDIQATYLSLIESIKDQFANEFMTHLRAAIALHDQFAARAYLAWRLAQHGECRNLAENSIREIGLRGFDARRFAEFLMFAVTLEEKQYVRRYRDYVVSVLQELDRRLETKEWHLPVFPTREVIETAIRTLGGVPAIHVRWLARRQRLLREKRQKQDHEQDQRRGVPEGTTEKERLDDLARRAAVKYRERKQKYFDLMTEMNPRVRTTTAPGIYLRTDDGTLFKFNKEEEQKIVAWRTS
jgi:hypothetical protein